MSAHALPLRRLVADALASILPAEPVAVVAAKLPDDAAQDLRRDLLDRLVPGETYFVRFYGAGAAFTMRVRK